MTRAVIGVFFKGEAWQVTTHIGLQFISQDPSSVCSHIRMHHPASSCADNMVRDSGMGGAVVGREGGRLSVCVFGIREGGS